MLSEGKATEIFRRIVDPLKGKYILVDFWAINCGPCRFGIQQMRLIRERYKGSNDFTFAYVTDEQSTPQDAYAKFIEENGMDENLYRLSCDDYNYLRQLFKFNGIPRYILVNREGNIVNDDFPAHNIGYELSKLFGEQ